MHQWALENPPAARPSSFQRRFRVSVWEGIVSYYPILPYLMANRLGWMQCAEFLEDCFPICWRTCPLMIVISCWFSTMAPFTTFHAKLNSRFPDIWIGHGGPISRPPFLIVWAHLCLSCGDAWTEAFMSLSTRPQRPAQLHPGNCCRLQGPSLTTLSFQVLRTFEQKRRKWQEKTVWGASWHAFVGN